MRDSEEEALSQSCRVVTKFNARDHTCFLFMRHVEKKFECGRVVEDLVEWLKVKTKHDASQNSLNRDFEACQWTCAKTIDASMRDSEEEALSQSCHVVTKFNARDHTCFLFMRHVEKKFECGRVIEDLVEWLKVKTRHDALHILLDRDFEAC